MYQRIHAAISRRAAAKSGEQVLKNLCKCDPEPLVLSRSFRRLVQRLKIKNLTFHDLRHDRASTLTMAGVPLRTVAEILGHRDIRMTARYAHLSPQHLRDAMRALDAPRTFVLEGATQGPGASARA